MSSSLPALSLTSNRSIDEHQWVIQIRRTMDEELEEDQGIPVCIFNVPKSLLATQQQAYTPQLISLGPYHRCRQELYDMDRYKLCAAKRIQKLLHSLKFRDVVEQIAKVEPQIRASYHGYLHFGSETLAWMMALDAAFLLDFLQISFLKEGNVLARVPSRMSHLIDSAGRRSAHNGIIRDIMMLENQIPLFVLRKFLAFSCSSSEIADDLLSSMLIGFVKELSPFKLEENFPCIQVGRHAHLLELLYHVLVPKSTERCEINESDSQNDIKGDCNGSHVGSGYFKQLLATIWSLGSSLKEGPIHCVKLVIMSRPMKFLLKLAWKMITSLPGLSIIKAPIESLFFSKGKENIKPEDKGSNNNTPPLVEEIMIPSITQLSNVGIKFTATNSDISTISFNQKTKTLYLPTVTLDVNTEVILRNLVAYEASAASGPLVFTRYTELMNGIVETEDDVEVLRKNGVILNHLKSDKEAADLWNGMSMSIRLSKVPFLDKIIGDVNGYYNCRWNVKMCKFTKKYVFGSWPILAFLAAILLLLLTGLQAFCSVYSCARWFNVQTVG